MTYLIPQIHPQIHEQQFLIEHEKKIIRVKNNIMSDWRNKAEHWRNKTERFENPKTKINLEFLPLVSWCALLLHSFPSNRRPWKGIEWWFVQRENDRRKRIREVMKCEKRWDSNFEIWIELGPWMKRFNVERDLRMKNPRKPLSFAKGDEIFCFIIDMSNVYIEEALGFCQWVWERKTYQNEKTELCLVEVK